MIKHWLDLLALRWLQRRGYDLVDEAPRVYSNLDDWDSPEDDIYNEDTIDSLNPPYSDGYWTDRFVKAPEIVELIGDLRAKADKENDA